MIFFAFTPVVLFFRYDNSISYLLIACIVASLVIGSLRLMLLSNHI